MNGCFPKIKLSYGVLVFTFLSTLVSHAQEGPKHPPPIALYTVGHVCLGDSSYVINKSLMYFSSLWSLSDLNGDTIVQSDSNHFYFVVDSAGTYTLTLEVSNGHTSVLTQELVIDSTPNSNFMYSHCGSTPENTEFFNLSTCYDSLLWDFGDGTYSNDTNPVHQFLSAGTYTINLTSYKGGDSSSYGVTETFDFVSSPTGGLSYFQIGDTVHFQADDTTAQGYYWQLGNGSTCWGTYNCLTVYQETDSFMVTLSSSNFCGNSEIIKTIYVEGTQSITWVEDFRERPSGINIYPNPSSGNVVVEMETADKRILVNDLTGKVIVDIYTLKKRLEVENLKEGMYIITVFQNESYLYQRKLTVINH
ncbi:MAG: T9SS type A sorting domain-containing protein [Flavobacteriales bacterium]|nr:T9SS type A sorting domain-containing protein [Flavobacteriales bacterium]